MTTAPALPHEPPAATGDAPLGPAGEPTVREVLESNGMDRRRFLAYCGMLATALALPHAPWADRIAEALTASPRLPLLWLNGQDCNGNIESLIRSASPTPSELLLDHLAVNYVELLSAGAGTAAEKAKADTIAKGGYVLVVEGGVPTGANGAYCTIGGRAFTEIVKEAAARAVKVIAVGSCAAWGGLPAAVGGVTGAVDVQTLLGTTTKVIRLPGCPVNATNVVGTLVYYLTNRVWPETDSQGRPFFAYGKEIHDGCPRKDYFEKGMFVRSWGDEGHRKGWCLRFMGCRGPETDANCRTVKFNGGTSYPINAGAPCLGCVLPKFWDVSGGLFAPRPADD